MSISQQGANVGCDCRIGLDAAHVEDAIEIETVIGGKLNLHNLPE